MIVKTQAKPIDTSKPVNERVAAYIAQTKDPYRLTCGSTPVELQFAQNAPSLEALLLTYFIRKKAHHCGG